MCVAQIFYRTTGSRGRGPARVSSREISTWNQLVCSFSIHFPRYYFVRVVCAPGNAFAHILRGPKHRIHIFHHHYNIYAYRRGVNGCIIHGGVYIYIMLFSPKRRWRRGALEWGPCEKIALRQLFDFPAALVTAVYCNSVFSCSMFIYLYIVYNIYIYNIIRTLSERGAGARDGRREKS